MTEQIPTPAVLDKQRGRRRAEALLAHVHDIREDADTVLTMDLDDIPWDDAVRVANELKMARAALGAAEEFVAKHIGEHWPGKWSQDQTVEGLGRVHPYRPRNTKWDNDDVVKAVVDHHMEALEGEIPDPREVVRWITEVAHIDYFRVGELKLLEIPVDDHRHVEYGVVRVSIRSDDTIGATTHE